MCLVLFPLELKLCSTLVNRPGTCGVFVLVFWGRGPLLFWLSITLALVKKTPAVHKGVGGGGVGLSVISSNLHLLKSGYDDTWDKNNISLLSSL